MKLAIIRVRGSVRTTKQVQDTFKHLGLTRKNTCVLKEDTPTIKGMLKKIEPFITWGPANDDTVKNIKDKKHLTPPKSGYGFIKKHHRIKGAYGNRKEKINDLIMRMQ
ncbi:hypothetical protein COV18_01810 [Candidatus Woesearchaeota archaeon CG10_big_fil_rev_8_21_14_0_10_37_12]|nr:MAG: hypothetical protein COV18_01810 [Candidatus Woesearchaeota archaeon CG10_big_fil_rev_8_21_14_0_10_37_12]